MEREIINLLTVSYLGIPFGVHIELYTINTNIASEIIKDFRV